MPYVPFIGRLRPSEYLALLGSFLLIAAEGIARIVTLALPGPIINLCYRSSRRLFNSLSSPQGRRSRNKKKNVVNPIAHASDFVELCELFGFYAEEHVVQTVDGYLLGLHRLAYRKGEEGERVNWGSGDGGGVRKKVVYLHHGLMMNSEVWVCLTEKERCLPFLLVEKGYDVWLGNNRGNKYSKKSTKRSPTDPKFWDFCIDQFAFHDIPDSIDYILSTTGQPSLSYIGFSQGTAQAFATLSIHPTLNQKVDLFIALAPAMSPPGLNGGIVNTFVKASPQVLFLFFGRRMLMPSVTMWQTLLYPPIFVRLIDWSLSFLFGWQCKNITAHQKLAAYPHLYSFTSVKSVVHWFQIIRTGTFQMYDDEVQAPLSIANASQYYKVAKFPTRNIKTPIVLVYGGSDSLVDINVMLRELPKHTSANEIPHYEHLDFLWASDVDTQVFPHVFRALQQFSPTKGVVPFNTDPTLLPSTPDRAARVGFSVVDDEEDEATPSSLQKVSENLPADSSGSSQPAARRATPSSLPIRSDSPTASQSQSQLTERSDRSRPGGWWSSDDITSPDKSPHATDKEEQRRKGETNSPDATALRRNGSNPSLLSVRSGTGSISEKGISVGKARAAVGQTDSSQGEGEKAASKKKKGRRKDGS